jgi:hypothetical protein
MELRQHSGRKAALIVLGLILLLGFISSLSNGTIGTSSASSGKATLMDSTAASLPKRARRARYADRQEFAEDYESKMLMNGMDMHASTLGAEARTLRLQYALISRPFAYQLSNDQGIMNNLQRLGFRQVIMTDGYEETYIINIDPSPNDPPSRAEKAALPKKRYQWVGDPTLQVVYYGTPQCQPAKELQKSKQGQIFTTIDDAFGAGYRRSDTKGCDD